MSVETPWKDKAEVVALVALVALIPAIALGMWVNQSWNDKRRHLAELAEAEQEIGCD